MSDSIPTFVHENRLRDTAMLAYRAHPLVTKAWFVSEMRHHRDEDDLIQRMYSDTDYGRGLESDEFRGCAVGCGIWSVARRVALGQEPSYCSHSFLAKYLGIPVDLIALQDTIFENLPLRPDALEWPAQFAEAIPDGGDLTRVLELFTNALASGAMDAGDVAEFRMLMGVALLPVDFAEAFRLANLDGIRAMRRVARTLLRVLRAAPVPGRAVAPVLVIGQAA